MKKIYISLSICSLFLLSACNTSRITSSWKAENVQAKEYKKILVLALINDPDRTVRANMEKHLVQDLGAMGYTAICSCEEFGPKAFENMKEQEALSKLGSSGVDAVLTVVLLDKQKERYYVPGRVTYTPYVMSQSRFWRYYNIMYDRVYSPGYYTTDTRYFWESNFYDLSDGQQLLYSVQSQSFEPGSAGTMAHEYSRMIVKDMVKQNIVKQVTPSLKSF